MDKIEKILTRSVSEVLPSKDALAKLMEKKKIRVYLGIDPTGTHLHLGHTIPLRKLQEFADLGHEAILLIGTGTVLAGDPSQRSEARAKITQEEIDQNIKSWKEQASKIIDLNKVQIRENGEWLLRLGLADILKIGSNISAVQLFKREMFKERLSRGDTVWFHETMYPLLQGYDSVVMDVDLEIGGTDQVFNMLIGRELQKKMNSREKFVLTTPLISGTDGQPMTKTTGNCIWLDDSAQDIYGKLMSINDKQLTEYWENLISIDPSEMKNLKPLDAKKRLAYEIVKIYHGEKEAQKAQSEFESVHQKGEKPQEAEEVKVEKSKWKVVDFLMENDLTESRSVAKRLLDQGAIEIDGQTFKENDVEFKNGQVVRIGKKRFVKINLISN